MHAFYVPNKYTCMLVVYGHTCPSTEVHPRTPLPPSMTEKTWCSQKSFYLPPNNQLLAHALHSTHSVMVNPDFIQSLYSYWRCSTVLFVIYVM